MSIMLNNVVIGGIVGKDPEIKSTSTGKKLATFSIAVSNGRDRDSDWFDIQAWDRQADVAEQFLVKGSAVAIVGRLSQSKWEDKEGAKRSRVLVVANSIQLVGGKRKENGGGGTAVMNDDDIPF